MYPPVVCTSICSPERYVPHGFTAFPEKVRLLLLFLKYLEYMESGVHILVFSPISLSLSPPNSACLFVAITQQNKMASWNFLLGFLLYHTLQAAWAQLPSQPESCSGQSQKISLSHSYKIDVPKSSQIKVEPDPLPLQDDSHTLLVGGETDEEQNIIFRHNIRLQTPKGDCEVLSQLKTLLERMAKMEIEVVHLKETCSPQRCCGRSQGESYVWLQW